MDPILEFCAIVLTFPSLWLVFILSSLVCLPFYVIRWVIGRLASFLHPEWAGMLGSGDIVFAEDPSSPSLKPHSILLGYTSVEGGLTLAELQEKYLTEVILSQRPDGKLNYPKFQQYFEKWCGYSFWKWEESFAIENHIRLLAEEEGLRSDEVLTETDLLTLLGPLGNRPFKKGQSPWEYLYVPSYFPKNGTAPVGLVIMRIHHSLGDGYSILKSFISYACGEHDKEKLLLHTSTGNVEGRRSKRTPKENLRRVLQRGARAVQLGTQFLAIPFHFTRHMLTIDSSPWFLRRNQLSRECLVGLTPKIPVQLVKDIGRQWGVSFSAILFAAVGGSVNRYFRRRANERIPDEIQCFTPFPRPGHPDDQLVNHFTSAIIKLFPGEQSSVERLRRNEVDLNGMKRSTFPWTMYFFTTILSAYPTWYVQLVGANWFATAILSNFPGPRDFLSYFQRYRVSDIVFWAPHLNGSSGIGISMLTYGDSLRFALNVDKTILSNQSKVDELCAYIEEELRSLSQSTNHTKSSDENQNKISSSGDAAASAQAQLRLRSVS